MPISIEIVDNWADEKIFNKAFDYFDYVDKKFSPFKPDSELSKINRGEIPESEYSDDMKEILKLAEETKNQTNQYFEAIDNDGKLNPSGIVKGWAIFQVSKILLKEGLKNFFVDAGGDIQVEGKNYSGNKWKIGLKNPFEQEKIVKVVYLNPGQGIATSGTYIRGDHIYNPKNRQEKISEIVSLSVIGPNVYEADRYATAIFAMGKEGIEFLEKIEGMESYMIDKNGLAYMTSNFEMYTHEYP